MATLERLYAAFTALDGVTMQACYAEDARFEDPVFSLRGAREIGGMWRMLCDEVAGTGPNRAHWRVMTSKISVVRGRGRLHWEVDYLFGKGLRPVHNSVDSRFAFDAEGRIRRQRDTFDFALWARQALGLKGRLLGGTSFFQNQVRRQAELQLQRRLYVS